MDSLTQIALGAAVGEAVLGRQLGNRAMIAGAIFGTVPDLDVLVPFNDAVASFTYHRSFSHSWIILTLVSPLLAWLSLRFAKNAGLLRWWWLVFLALNTHVLLDCFTVYGTQALWPLSNYPIGWSTIFIIDPIYTVPLILGLLVARRATSDSSRRRNANIIGLTASSAYLCWTIVAHEVAQSRAITALQEQGIAFSTLHTTPTPFSLLWRFNALADNSYLEGFHAFTDSDTPIVFSRYPVNDKLQLELKDHWPVQRLKWFTNDYYAMSEQDKVIYMTDLRMGIEASYVFNFRVASRASNGQLQPETSLLMPFRPDIPRLKLVFKRMFDDSISLSPADGDPA